MGNSNSKRTVREYLALKQFLPSIFFIDAISNLTIISEIDYCKSEKPSISQHLRGNARQ